MCVREVDLSCEVIHHFLGSSFDICSPLLSFKLLLCVCVCACVCMCVCVCVCVCVHVVFEREN